MGKLVVYGKHTKGSGKASIRAAEPDHTSIELAGVNLIGTYNIDTKVNALDGIPAAHVIRGVSYWLVQLNDEHYGWAMRWRGSKQAKTRLEIYTRKPLPDLGEVVKVAIFVPIADIYGFATEYFAKGHKWFQAHKWLPEIYRRHDATRVLEFVGDVRGKTVLDHGACEGQLATALARQGAIVTAVEKRSAALGEEITRCIEGMDVTWISDDVLPAGRWDIIFSLSVWHQQDPSYADLGAHLADLEQHGRKVFIELMTPPLKGKLDVFGFMRRCGYHLLETYQHPVRRVRSVFVK
jgi:hypothetical protein